MVSDQPNIRNPLTLLIFALLVLITTVAIMIVILSARQASLAKTQPYVIEFVVQSDTKGEIIAQYDYGFGYNKGHEQTFPFESNELPKTVDFTISAWKNLRSLRLVSTIPNSSKVSNITITKDIAEYQPQFADLISSESPLLFENVHEKLIEARK